ncbi:MAG TPA: hypothetical protein VJR89_08870, partial [Polyangiales bacterium]|nr:hypothetical protein [Polyangiales bacterium]
MCRLGIAALVLGACSVYDPQRLPGQGESSISTQDGGARDASADATTDDDCKSAETERCKRPHAEGACVDGSCVIQRC